MPTPEEQQEVVNILVSQRDNIAAQCNNLYLEKQLIQNKLTATLARIEELEKKPEKKKP